MRRKIWTYGFIGFVLLVGCETDQGPDDKIEPVVEPFQQLINNGDVTGSLNPWDLIERPAYSPLHEIDYIQDDEYVFISKACGYVLAYPHRSMHIEIVNEEAHGVLMAITYCPITRSGIGWNRILGEDTLLLTPSGYLFNENLMPIDLNSGSIWSQMRLQGMHGEHDLLEIQTIPLIETTWKTVRENFPAAGVFMNETFQKSSPDVKLEQDFGIISNEEVELFTLDMFPGEITLHRTTIPKLGRVYVVGSTKYEYITAFHTSYQMEPVEGSFPIIMKDETGTLWTIFGEAVSGERGGERIESPKSYTAAGWAWKNLYESTHYFQSD